MFQNKQDKLQEMDNILTVSSDEKHLMIGRVSFLKCKDADHLAIGETKADNSP